MRKDLISNWQKPHRAGLPLLIWLACYFSSKANPTGGTVIQGSASINTAGSQVTINQSSANAFINWQSFNLAPGEITTFNQPSASSVTWNYISDPNASLINGTINANGYVVLQNPNGFTIGGQATITAHGLVMTTAATPNLDLSSGGAWSFNAPPPTAKIVNYGQVNISGGGSAYLIASDIENNGTISAPAGKIGLYAGQKVLVSMAPDGRGLSAQVTLPQGSVDNEGKLIADAGSIAAQAQFVNQNGMVQANSVKSVNGVIELVASDKLSLGASSQITASGDTTSSGASPGGFVILNAANNTFSDQAGSLISLAGANGGRAGILEIFGNGVTAGSIFSSYGNPYGLLINPYDLTLSSGATSVGSNPNLNINDLAAYSQIDLQALDNITLSSAWSTVNANAPSILSLSAGNNINLNSSLTVGTGWDINLNSGLLQTAGGIYLKGASTIQAQDGDINLFASKEVIVNSGAIRTVSGGNISVTAVSGDVNTGTNPNGYNFGLNTFNLAGNPYYTVNAANLGGISTAAGGNVTITAGKNVVSGLPTQTDWASGASQTDPLYYNPKFDGGSGAFGAQLGNVTITAGKNVYGHYVLGNGLGTITAGGDVGVAYSNPNFHNAFALSLINGNWNVNAPQGNIYVQAINNPSGIFGEGTGRASTPNYKGYHLFDYGQDASVSLNALNDVEITGKNAPQAAPSVAASAAVSMPMILPPNFSASTVSGDFILDTSVILFPSLDQNLNLAIGGNFIGTPNGHTYNSALDNPVNLEMSDSAANQWVGAASFGTSDHAASPSDSGNANPVTITVAGNMQDINLYVDKLAQVNVAGNMQDCSFVGQNLDASQTTSINVGGSIVNSPLYSFESLSGKIVSANSAQGSVWDSVFNLAINPDLVSALAGLDANNSTLIGPNGLAYYLKTHNYLLFPSSTSQSGDLGINPGFVYDQNSLELGFRGNLSSALSAAQISALASGQVTVLVADSQGNPLIDPSTGHLQLKTYTFDWGSAVPALAADSAHNTTRTGMGFQIGGPGQFNISASSIDLGNSQGIISYGFGNGFGADFSTLQGVSGELGSGGAAVTVTAHSGDINMATSRICSIDGGTVAVTAENGNINLSQGDFVFPVTDCYGIWTSGHSDVSVNAYDDINIGNARIATFNGGNVTVISENGDVNCGTGQNIALNVPVLYLDAAGNAVAGTIGDLANGESLQIDPAPYGSGILAEYPTLKYQTPGGLGRPGNITVITKAGNIVSGLGGIKQFALDQTTFGDAVISLTAGAIGETVIDPLTQQLGVIENGIFRSEGNVLNQGAVIGGTINVTVPLEPNKGLITGFFESKHDANIAGNFSGTLVAGGVASFTGNVVGTVVGIGGINTGSASVGSATLLSQNVSSGNGSSQSTLGTSVSATTATQAAAQQSSQAANQQAGGNGADDDDQKKKKKPELHKVSRVTVLLSSTVPPQQ